MATGKKPAGGGSKKLTAKASLEASAASVATASPAITVTASDRERFRVQSMLQSKRSALLDTEDELRHRLVDASREEGQLILPAIAQVVLEIAYIRRRLSAISAGQDFRTPNATEEQNLLNAIRAVGAASDINDKVVDLVTATLNLVNTYRAKSTDPAA